MKLTIDKKEELREIVLREGGMFRKAVTEEKTVYVLEIQVETTDAEHATLRQQGWDRKLIDTIRGLSDMDIDIAVSMVVGTEAGTYTREWPFFMFEELTRFESNIIQSVRALQQRIDEKQTALSGGPTEVAL